MNVSDASQRRRNAVRVHRAASLIMYAAAASREASVSVRLDYSSSSFSTRDDN